MRARLPSIVIVVTAVIQALLFGYYVRVNLILQPYWDMYSQVTRYLQFREDGAWWSYLWEPHVQHRHVWMRLLMAFDVEALAGSGYPFVVVATACQLVTSWLLCREAYRGAPRELRTAAACLAVMLALTSVAAVDCATPINAIYPQAVMFGVLALVLFDPHAGDGTHDRFVHGRRVAALLSVMAAAFSNTVALVLWPILAWMAWRARVSRVWLLVVIAAGTLFTAWYLHGLPLSDGAMTRSVGLLEKADYFVTYMGLPWTRAAALSVPGRVLGAALAIAGVFAALQHGLFRSDRGRTSRLASAFIVFSLGSAVLATMGRADGDAEVLVPVRYTVLLAPLHVGLLLLGSLHVRPSAAALARTAAIAVALVLVVQQVAAGEAARRTTRAMRDTIQRFENGETTPDMTTVVFIDLEQARRQSNAIRAAGLYLTAK